MDRRRKVVVVGAGAVGSTFAYSLAQSGLADDIAIVDRNQDLCRGQVLDLSHGQPFFPTVKISRADARDYRQASLIVLTAGAAQKPGETRLQLIQKNSQVVESVCSDIVESGSSAVLLVVTNPVDIMTQVAIDCTNWEPGRVMGSGTVLDSARLRYLISMNCGVDVHNVHGYILGEHGDSEFAAWSMTHIAGMQIDEYCPVCGRCQDWNAERNRIEQEVRDSAYHIIGYKGATSFGVGMALVRICAAVLRGEKSVLTVSTSLQGEFGISDSCLSVPSVVSSDGVEKIVEGELPDNEQKQLDRSANVLKKAYAELRDAKGDKL